MQLFHWLVRIMFECDIKEHKYINIEQKSYQYIIMDEKMIALGKHLQVLDYDTILSNIAGYISFMFNGDIFLSRFNLYTNYNETAKTINLQINSNKIDYQIESEF
jgi:hypothetical protein